MSISDIQADATWGLQRITQQPALENTDPFALTYDYPFVAPAGAGASASPSHSSSKAKLISRCHVQSSTSSTPEFATLTRTLADVL